MTPKLVPNVPIRGHHELIEQLLYPLVKGSSTRSSGFHSKWKFHCGGRNGRIEWNGRQMYWAVHNDWRLYSMFSYWTFSKEVRAFSGNDTCTWELLSKIKSAHTFTKPLVCMPFETFSLWTVKLRIFSKSPFFLTLSSWIRDPNRKKTSDLEWKTHADTVINEFSLFHN